MPIGNMGAVHSVPKPGSPVLTEALNLIVAMGGGDKEVRKLLDEMRKVQVANEELYDRSVKAKAEAEARIDAADKADKALDKRREEFAQESAAAQNRIAKLDAEQKAKSEKANQEQDEREAVLDTRDEALSKLAHELKAIEADLKVRLADVEQREALLAEAQVSANAREAELDDAFARLRAILPKE